MLQQILQLLQQLVTWKNDVIANSKTTAELEALDPILRNALFRAFVSGQSKKISIQELIDEIASELALGNVPVVFKPVTIDFTTPGTTRSKIIAKLNASPNYVLQQGTLYIPYVQRIVLTNGDGITNGDPGSPNYAVIQEQYFLTQRINPDDEGIASIGIDGTNILSNGVRYFNTVDNRSFEPIDFYLGDIDSDDVWDVVNLLGPGTDPVGPLSTPNGTTVLFYATQDGDEKIWLYRGQQEQVGLGEPATDEDDFRLFPDEDQTDPQPTYQETKPQQALSDVVSATLFLNNHEGFYLKMKNPFYQSVFLTRRIRLGGFSRALINTSGQTNYPVVKNKWLVKLRGTSGTATLTIGVNDYVFTYSSDLNTTATNFVSANAATILSTNSLSLIYNSDGYLEFDGTDSHVITIANTTGTLNGLVETIPSVMINTPEFLEGLFDMYCEFDGNQINYRFSPRVLNGFNGFTLKIYDDIDDLLANQSEQRPNALYLVIDASDDTNITFASGETKLQAEYRFNGTATGSIDDYTLISAPYGNHSVSKQITKTENYTLDPTENDTTIISEGKICTIDPITKTYPAAFTVAMKNDGAATNLVIVPKTGWSYQLNDGDAVSLTTGGSNVTLTWTKGGTCTVILKGSTNKIMIDGGVE